MDRRNFVVGSVASVSTFTLGACAGSASASASVNDAAKPSPVDAQAPVNPIDPQQFLTWDGGSGPSRDYWSQKLRLPWLNSGRGDWLDAKQNRQGSTPYAVASIVIGRSELDVTNLVDRWLKSKKNPGFYLRSKQDWAFTFAGRTYLTASSRPQLIVVSNGVTTTIDCISNATWSPSTFKGKDSRDSFLVAQDSQFAALHFDISMIPGPVQSAKLLLTCLSLKYPGNIELFELAPPEFRNGAGSLPARSGLADNFSFDKGLRAHPSVIFSSDFSDLSKKVWQSGSVAGASSQVKDLRTGSTYLRGLIPAGQLWGCDLERTIVGGSATGKPSNTETELYARYYVFLEEDWGSGVDANKMPGWDGRFGWWNSSGYWQNTTGNGGARPTGLKVRNTTANRWEYEGASMRGHGGTSANDGNPYDDMFWIGSYIYHLDQVGAFGESIRWSNVVVGKGRWYCIEQYIKMNSISGPFDEVGNGTAINDGQYKVWVDGVEAYERSNFRWRRHPEMGIQGFWLNWYHGGTAAAPHAMHFRMDSVVIARNYIGPRNERI